VGDIGMLLNGGSIIPDSSDTSPLIVRSRYGDGVAAHPAPLFDASSQATLVQFIDTYSGGAKQACGPLDFRSRDDVQAAMLADIQQQAPEDRAFTRYVDMTYATNAGACGSAVLGRRTALIQLLNGVSTAPAIAAPRYTDENELVIAVDMRALGWNRRIDLQGDGSRVFEDAWQAIVANVGPYALELEGPEADELTRLTGSPVPALPGNALLAAAATGDLYYALTGARERVSELAVALQSNPEDTAWVWSRAGVSGSVSGNGARPDRMVTRLQPRTPSTRAFWVLEELAPGGLRAEPVDHAFAGAQVMFNLPNGMPAYAVLAQNGATETELRGCAGGSECSEPRALNAVTCNACHVGNAVAMTDELRAFATANPDRYAGDELARIQAEYTPVEEFLQIVGNYNVAYQAVREAARFLSSANSVGYVFYEFQRDALTPRLAAAELGVSVEQLREAAAGLGTGTALVGQDVAQQLQSLASDTGQVSRAVFSDGYVGLSCALKGARNRPVNCPTP
jgi:hypothetical protein